MCCQILAIELRILYCINCDFEEVSQIEVQSDTMFEKTILQFEQTFDSASRHIVSDVYHNIAYCLYVSPTPFIPQLDQPVD